MIPCQVSMIAEICICHAKICETVLRYKTTVQNSYLCDKARICDEVADAVDAV